jgi:hypothetical protein
MKSLPVDPVAATGISSTAKSAHDFNQLATTVALTASSAGSSFNAFEPPEDSGHKCAICKIHVFILQINN